jgi:hypothetical protein
MTEEKRVLTVNQADFNLSNNNNNSTRKKKSSSNEGRIKMKPPTMPKRNETLRKKALLRMIRSEQQRNLDEMTTQRNNYVDKQPVAKDGVSTTGFHSSFNKATSYLDNLVNKSQPTITTPNIPVHNHTIKNHAQHHPTNIPTLLNPGKPTVEPLPELTQVIPSVNVEKPKYGCLKNGDLPTYRSWLNKTQSNKPPLNWDAMSNNDFKRQHFSGTIPTIQNTEPVQMQLVETDHFKIPEYSEPVSLKLKGRKQKRRVVRTHKLGRSKYYSKIGVLISNKTIRNRVVNQKQQLKKMPIREVRKYLIKQGFIKVGSDTPSDVLREMYESALLMCGEVKNNNVDTLLHNFIHNNNED